MAVETGYRHGVYTSEVATGIIPMTTVTAPTVAFGTAPIHLASNAAAANEPIMCTTMQEFVEQFGWSDDYNTYTLCEVAAVHFQLFGVAPVVFVNVLDQTQHKKATTKTISGVSNEVEIDAPIILSSIVAKTGTGEDEITLVSGTDYTAAYNDDGKVVLTVISQSKVVGDTVALSYDEIDATAVTNSDIIGGVSITTGANTGMELVEEIFPRFGVVPGQLIAPKYSENSAVAAMLKAKADAINGCFKAMAIVDIPTASATRYTECKNVKDTNNLVGEYLIACYPKVALSGTQYYLSTQIAALMGKTDAGFDGIPYKSPSNESLQCDQTLLADGTDLFLGKAQANYLNGQGIVTALNFIGGWKAWGNNTSIYPSNTDPKNRFIPVRRMFNWITNTLVTSFWQEIDNPMNRRLIESIVDRANIWLNGLSSRGALVGGRVEVLDCENPTTDLLDGIIKFHVYVAPPAPAREISFVLEYDTNYMSNLFE